MFKTALRSMFVFSLLAVPAYADLIRGNMNCVVKQQAFIVIEDGKAESYSDFKGGTVVGDLINLV